MPLWECWEEQIPQKAAFQLIVAIVYYRLYFCVQSYQTPAGFGPVKEAKRKKPLVNCYRKRSHGTPTHRYADHVLPHILPNRLSLSVHFVQHVIFSGTVPDVDVRTENGLQSNRCTSSAYSVSCNVSVKCVGNQDRCYSWKSESWKPALVLLHCCPPVVAKEVVFLA